jgi:tRNA (guanine-N7-)-methyltransferase
MVLPRLQPQGSVSAFFLHFPDPWWKKRQQKRLVLATSLVTQMTRLLEPGGLLFVQTDVVERAEAYEALLSACEELVFGGEDGSPRIAHCPWSAVGNRERRALENGIPIRRLLYRRRSP